MNKIHEIEKVSSVWADLADRVLAGHRLTAEEGLAVLQSPDEELLDLLAAVYRIRRRWFGNEVSLNFLINAKSGHCSEDCGYCAQSRVSKAEISRYRLITAEEVLEGARVAAERRARTYCTVISGRSPSDDELETLSVAIPEIKRRYGLKICFSVGLLSVDQASRLKACGVDRINHNLNTSERYYAKICSTHSYQDRLNTLRAVRQAGLEICCGGIVGMGEEDPDVVELALRVAEFEADAVPVNFFEPIPGTPLAGISQRADCGTSHAESGDCSIRAAGDAAATGHATDATEESPRLNARYCLKVLAMFRLANPRCELRIAAGRAMHLGPLQPLGLYAANSIFVDDYLTTKNRAPEEDYRMIEAMGFRAVRD
jgi:biotin synthase